MWNISLLPIWFPSIKTLTFCKLALILVSKMAMRNPPFKRNPYLKTKSGWRIFLLNRGFTVYTIYILNKRRLLKDSLSAGKDSDGPNKKPTGVSLTLCLKTNKNCLLEWPYLLSCCSSPDSPYEGESWDSSESLLLLSEWLFSTAEYPSTSEAVL